MKAAIQVEALKLRRSPIGTISTCSLLFGTLALLGGITAGVHSGNPELTAQAGPAAALNWTGLLAGAAQITSVGGILGFGVVLSWMFGREFTDGTITCLFALPVRRSQIALAKLIVYGLWLVMVSVFLTVGIAALGVSFGYGVPDSDAWVALVRQLVLTLLTGAVAVPVAWMATVTRSLLASIGGAIGLVIVAQVGALAGAGGWMPVAAPALWAMSGGTAVRPAQLALTLALAAIFIGLTCTSWARLQLNR